MGWAGGSDVMMGGEMIPIWLEGLLYIVLFLAAWGLLGWIMEKMGLDKNKDDNDGDDGMSTMMSGLC